MSALGNNAVHHRLNNDFEYFVKHAPMCIKDKAGKIVPWEWNIAQRYIHDKLEEQRRATGGWVRALLLKGRQQGASTYVEGRFYHRTRSVPGTSAFILSHEGKTTDKLFKMVDRYHEHVHPALQPAIGRDNDRELTFPGIHSDYAAGTAGNKDVGRGGTAQLFHGSETAYWEHDYAIQDGALESIALIAGTEIILESTANGPKGLFYEKCKAALKGKGDYILVFVPWFWQEEYERPIPEDFELTEDEEDYVRDHFSKPFPYNRMPISRDKALRKMVWRRGKIFDFSTAQGGNIEAGEANFCRVYPSDPIEAFQASGAGLVRAEMIRAARKSTLIDPSAPIVAGVDPAGDSDRSDRTIIAIRQGRHLKRVIKYTHMKPMELAGILARLIDTENLDMVFIDRGYGEGTIDRLHEMGYGRKVIGIAFNERALEPDIYMNKRSEIIIKTAQWINGGGVSIPDDDDVHADLASMPLAKETSHGLQSIPPKDQIKRVLKLSTDIFDGIALTFSYPVRRDLGATGGWRKAEDKPGAPRKKGSGPLKSLSRMRGRRHGGY